MRAQLTTALIALGLALVAGCGSEYGSQPTNTDPSAINGCTTFVDHTASDDARALAWTFSITTDPDRCMTIKVGQTVRFDGDQSEHPIEANAGDAPSPISAVAADGTMSFDRAGVFGYQCAVHPSMRGAIKVVP